MRSIAAALAVASAIRYLVLRRGPRLRNYSFELVLRNAIEAGGDTDTVASIAGQIASAWLGAEQIPGASIDSLPDARNIERIAHEFASTLAGI